MNDLANVAATDLGRTLYYPIPTGDALNLQLAKRPASIKGLTFGFLGNLKPNCDVLLHTAEAEMMKLGAAGTMYREKSSCSLGAPSAIFDEIAANCQAAVVALGD